MDEAYHIRCYGTAINNGFAEGPNKFLILTEPGNDVTQLQIGFEGPSSPDVKLVTLSNNNVSVTFVPIVGGDYRIHILYKGHHIYASPFKCKIVGDVASNVKKMVCGGATTKGKVGQDNSITLDGRKVGISGGLTARLVGPAMPTLTFLYNEDATITLGYNVTSPGLYKLFIKFQHFSVPGSPFSILCT
ncbi:filamin-B [Folsomia candida]|uniref:filamin-B n=1 Tax=Folsomia candida TaxID=158441 RepID=UPI000B8F2311|nr:filamin-B [Folsomia candida]